MIYRSDNAKKLNNMRLDNKYECLQYVYGCSAEHTLNTMDHCSSWKKKAKDSLKQEAIVIVVDTFVTLC